MSETVELFRAMRDHTKALRAKYGVACPRCAKVRPRAHPSILSPQQRCRVDGYVDPRPELTDAQWREGCPALQGSGIKPRLHAHSLNPAFMTGTKRRLGREQNSVAMVLPDAVNVA